MDCSVESVYKKLVALPIGIPKTRYNRLHLAILHHYLTFLQTASEQDLPNIFTSGCADLTEIHAQELKKHVFTVPTLKEGQHGINKFTPVKEFISFLARLLYHKPGSISKSCGDRVKNVEKELRFLLAVLGDSSLMAEQESLLAEFVAVANEAGRFVHSLLFLRTVRAFGDVDVLNHIKLLKANIMKLSDVAPACMSRATYKMSSNNTSAVESRLVFDLLVRDVEDLMNRDDDDDDQIADVKDQIQTLHRGLISLQPFIRDTGFPQDQLKEYYMHIGDLAHQAQHLIVSFLAGDAPPWYLVNGLIHVNHKIELCRIELSEITKKCKFGGLEVAKYFNKQMSLSLPKSVDEDIVGFEDKMTYILDQLVRGGPGLRVISIFGMPGLGKTTLAKKVYNHPLVNERFDRLSWCVVSQSYLRRDVLVNILIHIASDQLVKDVILEMEEDRLTESIHKTLMGRRYLIVMDDIWDSDVCGELLRCFPDDGNESRILFTTRNRDVVPHDCIMYELPSLSDDQCWELIQKKVFKNQPCPQQLVKTGQELAAGCRGMPLAAVVIAGILLTTNREERAWEEVTRNLSLYIIDDGDNSVMQILKLSYDHLPQHLKLCFLYLGAFFVDQEIPSLHMMNMWISEGFIHGENEKNAAEKCLTDLIDKSLVMVSQRKSDGGPKTCLIHDLLRELCLKTCKEEKLMRFVNNKYLEKEEDHLKVGMNSTTWMCCQYMRNRFGRGRTSGYQIEVPDMRLLRVFYFSCSFIYLTGIEYLVCLKYLVVRELPPSIDNLVNLEYLRVVSNKSIYLTSTIMKMKKLKYVDAIPGVIYHQDCNISLTNKLEFLSRVCIWTGKEEKMLKCSPHLHRLKCFYFKWQICKGIDLSFLTRLESLSLEVHGIVFGGLIMSLPSSIKKLSLNGLWSKLSRKTMSMIGRLENLEVLKLTRVVFEGNRWHTRDGEFQKLRYLKLNFIGFTRWKVESSQHFPRLEQLELYLCYQLGRIPAEIGEIPTLQTIGVDWLLKESARRIKQEQRDMGNEELRVVMRSHNKWHQIFFKYKLTSLLLLPSMPLSSRSWSKFDLL